MRRAWISNISARPALLAAMFLLPSIAIAQEQAKQAPSRERISMCGSRLSACLAACRGNIRMNCGICRIWYSQCTGDSRRAWLRRQQRTPSR